MRPFRLSLATCVLALLSASCSRELSLPEPLPATGFISGVAVSEIAGTDQAQAVAGVQVSVPGTNIHGVSDPAGAFAVGPLPPGTYRLLLALGGTSGGESHQRLVDGVTVVRGATKTLGAVSLHRSAQVAGRVLLDGKATGNAGVVVFIPGTELATATGDNGQYNLRGIPEGVVRISAYRAGFTPASTADMSAQGGVLTTAVDLVLPLAPVVPQPGAISGRIVAIAANADLSPLSLQTVALSLYEPGSATPKLTANAKADGSFELDQVPQGIYWLRASVAGFPPVDVPYLLVTGGTSIHLPDALVLTELNKDNVAVDGGPPGGSVLPGTDAGPGDGGAGDGGTGGGSDAGSAQCTSDAQCSSGNLCVNGFCVPCRNDSDCQSGYVCRQSACTRQCQGNLDCPGGQVCSAGTCGACVTSSDCRDAAKVCLPGGACGHCRDGNDCPTGKACLAAGCGACTGDADCGAGRICDGSGACIPGTCHDNSGCPATQICGADHSCGSCASDSQCSSGRLCLGAAGATQCVVANCRSKQECTSAQACLSNLCGACAQSTDCGPKGGGLLCDPQSHSCVPGDCNTDSECVTGKVCSGHSCIPCGVAGAPACTAGVCNRSSDCAGAFTGFVCKSNACISCSAASDCDASQTCALSQAQPHCVSGDCDPKTGCANGQVCVSNHCTACGSKADCEAVLGTGHACTAQGKCITGQCVTGADCSGTQACVGSSCQTCTADSQCDVGKLCLSGQCLPATCRTRAECSGGKACVSNQCGQCSTNGDCGAPGSGLVCDPATRLCTAGTCNADADCGAGSLCVSHLCVACGTPGGPVCPAAVCNKSSDCTGLFAGFVCKNNACVTCSAASECDASQTCALSLAQPKCVAGNCDPKTGCSNGQLCVSNTCRGCSTKADCELVLGAGHACTAQGICISGACATAGDCASHQACVGNACVACTADGQCGSGNLCLSGQCLPGNCRARAECTGGQACIGNQCGSCGTNADCGFPGSGFVCDPTAHLCTAGNCNLDSDCGSGKYCSGHTCNACGGTSGHACPAGVCNATSDCTGAAAGLVCKNNACVSCSAAADCGSGQTCALSTAQPKCIAGDCDPSVPCANGQICVANQCSSCGTKADCEAILGSGHACTAQGKCITGECAKMSDCASGHLACIGSACQTCTLDSQCDAGNLCLSGQCLPGNCKTRAECSGGQACVGNTCGSCAVNADCGYPSSGYVCDPATKLCAAGTCNVDTDCANAGQYCSGHACLACGGSSGHACPVGNCNAATDCSGASAGMTCINNACVQCGSASECAAGQTCTLSATQHLCVAGDCDKTADCKAPGKVCVSNRCTACSGTSGAAACPAGQCNAQSDCKGPYGGDACVNNACVPCVSSAQCTAGQVCTLSKSTHLCVAGTCDTAADCQTTPGMICVSNQCTTCATNTDCTSALGASHVCVFPTAGQPGQCIAGTCARNSECGAGQACIGNLCQACGADANCDAGSICIAGVCTQGSCHDIKDCTSKGQVCVSNQCTSCTVESPVTSGGGGCNVSGKTSGYVCDSGTCVTGGCVQNTDCLTTGTWNGLLCSNHACQACSAATSAQCGSGYACISGKCTLGGCNTNADCPSPTALVCNTTTHTCFGNCRTGADCISTGYCNASSTCAACATSADCGTGGGVFSGLVCAGGKCVTGTCNADVTPNSGCPSGQLCSGAHACVQVAPTIYGTGPSLPAAGNIYNASPALVEGRSGYYFSAATLAGGTEVGLFDPVTPFKAKWMVADGTVPNTPEPALVLPAPGMPGDEVFFAQSGNVDWAAHSAVDGSKLWSMNTVTGANGSGGFDLAAGVVNPGTASSAAVVYSANAAALSQLRADGTGLRKLNLSNGSWQGLASGTSLLYALTTTSGLVGVNPNTMTIAFTLPYTGWNASYTTVSNTSSIAITRLPSGNGDRIWFSGFATGTGTVMFAADMLDADVAAARPATIPFPSVVLNTTSANGANNPKGNVLIDGQQSAYLLGTGANFATLYKVTPPAGAGSATLNVVTTPFMNLATSSQGNSWYALLGDPSAFGVSVVSYDSAGQLVDLIITGSNQYTTQWTLAHPGGGSWAQMWPGITSSGLLDMWGSTGGPASVKLLQALNGATFKAPANSWPVRAGDSGGHAALSLQAGCTSDANCTSNNNTQTCVLGQCVGQCRAGKDCLGGLGCSAGLCTGCSTDLNCGGSTNLCYATTCISCTGPACCHTTAECTSKGYANNTCVGGTCEASPAYYADLQGVLASTPDYPAIMAEGTDGVVYVLKAQSGGKPVFIAYDPATGSELWRTATVPQTLGTTYMAPMVVSLPGALHDTIFWADSATSTLFSFSGGSSPTSTPIAITTTPLPTKVYGSMALGSVKVTTGKIDVAGGTPVPVIYGYGPDNATTPVNRIWAVDATQAAAGTLKTWWVAPTQCSVETTTVGTGLYVLGDGAVLHACATGSATSGVLQLWEPNGDGTNAATVNGKTRWAPLTAQLWSSINFPRGAVGQVGTTDVVYLPATTSNYPFYHSALVVIPIVRGALNPPTPIPLFIDAVATSGMSVLADAKGNGIIVTDGAPGSVTVVTPSGALGTPLTIANHHASGASLGSDGLLYTEGNSLNGILFDSALKPFLDFSVAAPNNVNFGDDQMMLLHGGRLVVAPMVLGPGRDLVFYNVGTKDRAPSPAWSTWGGDNQRRQSVEALLSPSGF